MPRTGSFALLLLLGTALWGFVPALVYSMTGWRMDPGLAWHPANFSSPLLLCVLLATIALGWKLLFAGGGNRTAQEEARTAAGAVLLFLFLGYSLQAFQSEVLSLKIQVPPFRAFWAYGAAGACFLGFLAAPARRPWWPLAVAAVFLLLWTLVSVQSFPLLGSYSEMYFTMQEAGRFLLQGQSPYSLQPQWDGYRCCYWPGMWLSYLPALPFGLDPRWLGTLFWLLFAGSVWAGANSKQRPLAVWFLVLLMLNPWSLLRNDVYLSAYLLTWALFFLALRKGKGTWAAGLFGWGLASHPFSWVLLPVWLAWSVRREGWAAAFRSLGRALGLAALVLVPFFLWDPAGTWEGLVARWIHRQGSPPSNMGLAAWLGAMPLFSTALVAACVVLGAWAVGRGPGDLGHLLRWSAVTLGLSLVCSFHTEHYYYFVPMALVLLSQAWDEGQEPAKAPQGRGPSKRGSPFLGSRSKRVS